MLFTTKPHPLRELILFVSVVIFMFSLVMISLRSSTQLDYIRDQGILRVATINNPMTYYLERGEAVGFEYELTKAFAEHLGVELELYVSKDLNELFSLLNQRSAHFIAANLLNTDQRLNQLIPGPTYRESAPSVIYRTRQGFKAPKSIEQLYGKTVAILANSSYADILEQIQLEHTELTWEERENQDMIDLLRSVHNNELDFTLIDSYFFNTQRSFFPGLRKAFVLGDAKPISWFLTKSNDTSLLKEMHRFFALEETQTLIETLEARYFSQENPLNFFDTLSFRKHLEERLVPLEPYFKNAANETGFAWELLAALGYQESHWNPDAVSATGVRGIMMLTHAAASEVDVDDRTDPEQSIMGGARYLHQMKRRIPDRIPEPDHTWFALAAYNIGYGHLLDARRLTQQKGKNPDRWEDVRLHLPLLAQERYYSQLRHGYARGHEPVQYVDNIIKYMDILQWELQSNSILEQFSTLPPLSEDSLQDISERVLRNFAPSL